MGPRGGAGLGGTGRPHLQRALPGTLITREHLWLLSRPNPHIDSHVWSLAALIALFAMDYGRRLLWRHHNMTSASAARLAALQFWAQLQDFAAVHVDGPFSQATLWMAALGDQHPFLCNLGDTLVVQWPDGLQPLAPSQLNSPPSPSQSQSHLLGPAPLPAP